MTPAIAPAQAANRVQGIDSSLDDLVLRDGRRLHIELGGAIKKGSAQHVRTIGGGSSVTFDIHDHQLGFLDASLLAEKFDAQLDGLHYRYIGADLREDGIGITLKDRDIAVLEEFDEPMSASRDDTTRAEFIIALVRKARPAADIFSPQQHVIQPIETKKQAKSAKDEATANRGKGLDNAKGLTMDGASLSPAQLDLGDEALRIGESGKAPYICLVSVIEALMAETGLGEAEPNNVLEALGPGGAEIRPAAEEISGFLFGKPTWTGTTAVGYHKANPNAPAHEIAQAVQKSAFADGSNYAKFEPEARAMVDAFAGGEFAGDIGGAEIVKDYKFEVCGAAKDKNWWEGIKRLAKEVSWRAFWVAGRFFYVTDIDLYRGMVRFAIDRETPGIQSITGSWRANRPATDMTIKAFATKWKVPPGAVLTLEGYGPFSIGFGDAPPKKGQMAISQNRAAGTRVGRARYLLETIEAPIRDSDTGSLKLVTVKVRKPTAPLPEPAAETKKLSTKSGGVGFTGGTGEMGSYEGTAEDVVNQVIDYAHSHGFPAITRESVRQANAAHGPTVDGGRSDHQGPPDVAWAADISNGETTPEEDALAQAIADAFGIPWSGSGLVTHEEQGYRLQLIYRTMEGGNHYTHVHFGCEAPGG